MTPNQSLELTCRMREAMSRGTLQFLEPVFPIDVVRSYQQSGGVQRRDRVYNSENTLMTMVLTAVQTDRSLQNSVRIFQEVHSRSRDAVVQQAQAEQQRLVRQQQEALARGEPRPRGRPRRLSLVRVARSKLGDVSANTGCYSRARERVELGLVEAVFKSTASGHDDGSAQRWHGRLVYNTDGTYIQMQDTPGIGPAYRTQKNSQGLQGYPQGLLQVLTQQGSGTIVSYIAGSRADSELKLMARQVQSLPRGSLLLADAMYDCYAFICLLLDLGIDVVVPLKKVRTMSVVRNIGPSDDIVELPLPRDARPLFEGQKLRPSITLRRISYPNTQNPDVQHVLLTTILDESIDRTEIVNKYSCRWDIEITIREIKTLMGMNIARGQTEQMVFKEIGAAMIAYNLIRKIIATSAKEVGFPPQTDFLEELLADRAPALVDRKGRVYSRWAPGRPAAGDRQSRDAHHSP
jgi:hypothetical protein